MLSTLNEIYVRRLEIYMLKTNVGFRDVHSTPNERCQLKRQRIHRHHVFDAQLKTQTINTDVERLDYIIKKPKI